ncbi:MAG: type I secretion system permease/ATPase [Hyphomicrobium sp.]
MASHPNMAARVQAKHPVASLLLKYAPILTSVAVFSGVINLLALAGSFYMLQVYDRVLPSQSVPTLIGLSILMVGLYVVNGVLEYLRSRIMSRVGTRIDKNLSPKVFNAVQILPLRSRSAGDGMQPIRDLDTIRSFMSGLGLPALFDLPWMPIYLFFVYLLHPSLFLIAAGGAILLIILTMMTEYRSSTPLKAASQAGGQRLAIAEQTRRNAEAIYAMGLSPHIGKRYEALSSEYLAHQLKASDAAGGIGNLTKVIRMVLQSAVLGYGAYLVIQNEISSGAIIAASITVSRSLAPIETAIAHWKGFIAARLASKRLGDLITAAGEFDRKVVDLPAPQRQLQVESLVVGSPGTIEPIIKNVSFTLERGDALGVIGPSGSGKSTLARALVGVWRPMNPASAVRLDGASLDQWTPDKLGRHMGYMPQDVELFEGTIAENIARFDPEATSDQVVAAAKAAGAHDLIVRLGNGYQTRIGEAGRSLSGGERQRVALARALYGNPFFVVLDEPNASLDAAGDAALTEAILSIRRRGGIAIVIAHRPSALAAVNKVLVLANGQTRAFGPKDEVLRSILQTVPQSTGPNEQPRIEGGEHEPIQSKDSA